MMNKTVNERINVYSFEIPLWTNDFTNICFFKHTHTHFTIHNSYVKAICCYHHNHHDHHDHDHRRRHCHDHKQQQQQHYFHFHIN